MNWTDRNKDFIRQIQEFLGVDADGLAGDGTMQAWSEYAGSVGPPGKDGNDGASIAQAQEQAREIEIIQGFPHDCQGNYDKLMIGVEPTWKSVKRIGCLSCVVELHRAFWFGDTPDVPRFVEWMQENNGYDSNRDLRWEPVKEQFRLEQDRDITLGQAKQHVAEGRPVIVCERTQYGGTHFTVGIGRTPADDGWLVINPGRQTGSYYENPANVKMDSQVIRLDVVTPV